MCVFVCVFICFARTVCLVCVYPFFFVCGCVKITVWFCLFVSLCAFFVCIILCLSCAWYMCICVGVCCPFAVVYNCMCLSEFVCTI